MSENILKHLTSINTKDGSPTLEIRGSEETYHSRHGAVQESMHVFIRNGLEKMTDKNISILEVGLGTGLNALLTQIYAQENSNINIYYHALEAYPLEKLLNETLDFSKTVQQHFPKYSTTQIKNYFLKIIQVEWNQSNQLTNNFQLEKDPIKLETAQLKNYNLIYYDAFGPKTQEEMWEKSCFEKITPHVSKDGLLVTYCAQGAFRRNLVSLGWEVNKIPGPPGKREMVVAHKI